MSTATVTLAKGAKVRYIGDTEELRGLEGVLYRDIFEHDAHTKVTVTKDNHAYLVGSFFYPDTRNLELIETEESAVNSPSHYTQYPRIEVIQLTEHMDFCRGNAVKYLARAGAKDKSKELEDLMKARWYTDRAIAKLQRELASNTQAS